MSKQKLSPWFPGGTHPERPGVYQRAVYGRRGFKVYARWMGTQWSIARTEIKAAAWETIPSPVQTRDHRGSYEWRGILKEWK